jgi:polysaccharide biosynthesis/export protein
MITKLRLTARHAAVIALALLVGACVYEPVRTVVREKPPVASQAAEPVLKRPTLLRPGDKVDVFVWGYTDFTRSATVTFDGALPYPVLGDIPVAGKSAAQVEEDIRAALGDYIKEPIVRVSVATPRPPRVQVLGEVRIPGNKELSKPNTTLVEVIAMAGGLTPDARPEAVILVQGTDKQIRINTIDFDRVTRAGDPTGNLVLADGDLVFVPVGVLADIARDARRISDIVSSLWIIENTTILFEGFLKALTHAPDRPGQSTTVQTVIVR